MRGIRPSHGNLTDRKEPRHNLSMKVRYRHDDYLVIANTRNISPGGMFLQTPTIPPLGSEILFTLYPPYASDSLELSGRIAWQHFGSGVGVEFNQRIPDGF
jgi:Tfp pilus assembly protein PilZ